MILRSGDVAAVEVGGSHPRREVRLGAAGGPAGLGANVVTRLPGQISSERHGHARSDEVLLVMGGTATVIEDDGPHDLLPCDCDCDCACACWPAGVETAHHVRSPTDAPVRYPVVGTNPPTDRCRYPESGPTMVHAPPDRWVEADDGTVLRRGTV